jgi:hypothetical protein
MGSSLGAMDIEFLFEKCVNRRVKTERITRRLAHAQPPVKVEAARAIQEQVQLAPAYLEWFT